MSYREVLAVTEFLRANLYIIIGLALVGLWLLLRTHATKLGTGTTLGGLIGAGRPTVLEFFSNT